MIKVLMFGWEFPPHITGGLGTACFGLTKALLTQDVEVRFVVPKAFGDESTSAIRLVNASQIPVRLQQDELIRFHEKLYYLEANSAIRPYTTAEQYKKIHTEKKTHYRSQGVTYKTQFNFSGKYGSNLLEEVANYALVGGALAKKYDFDLIHAHDWLTYAAGVEAKNKSGKPLIVHMHATEFDRSGEHVNQSIYQLERYGMEQADRVIAVSNLTRKTVIERYGIAPEKVVTVHNAVDPVSHPKKIKATRHVKEKVVTFLGRITYQKGPEYFVEAAQTILKKDKNVRFVMAGTGDMMPKLIRRVAKLGMGNKFHFTGFLKGPEVDHMFALSDVFVMPSVSEPFGLVPLEAMRSHVPVVISRQSGVSEILQHALKVDFWDVHALADSIYGLLHYSALSKMFTKYGKDEVDQLKWENAALKVNRIYQTTIDPNDQKYSS